MERKRHTLWILLVCILLAVSAALGQSTLTQVRDNVTKSDGTPFNGTVAITWNGSTTSTSGTLAPLSTSARIYNGVLSVLLVPNSTSPGSFYQVTYYNSDGLPTWSETWQVSSSTIPVTLSSVRTSTTQGGQSGGSSGSGGGTSGGTGGGNSGGPSSGGQYATLPIAINQVTSLGANLASINSAITALNAQVTNLAGSNTAVSTGNTAFVDSDTPSGTIDGSNAAFALAQTPSTGTLAIYRNGLFQTQGVDYTLSGPAVNFLPGSLPRGTDVLTAYYRVAGPATTVVFVDSEVPSGTGDGNNLVFTLNNAPAPVNSLKLYKNGVLMSQSGDYVLSGNTITFVNATVTPQAGDLIVASYRR